MASQAPQPAAKSSSSGVVLLSTLGLAVVLVGGYFLASAFSAEDAPQQGGETAAPETAGKPQGDTAEGASGGSWSVGPKAEDAARASADLAGLNPDTLRGPCQLQNDCVSLGSSCPIGVLASQRSLAEAYAASEAGKALCESAAKRYAGKQLEFQSACRQQKCVSVARRPGAPRISKPGSLRPSRQQVGLMKKNMLESRQRAKLRKARAGKKPPDSAAAATP